MHNSRNHLKLLGAIRVSCSKFILTTNQYETPP